MPEFLGLVSSQWRIVARVPRFKVLERATAALDAVHHRASDPVPKPSTSLRELAEIGDQTGRFAFSQSFSELSGLSHRYQVSLSHHSAFEVNR